MRAGSSTCFVAFLLPLLALATSRGTSGAEKTKSPAQTRYASPKAVFEAYREARAKLGGKIYPLLTPEVQKNVVYETFFECMEAQGGDTAPGRPQAEEIGRLVRKYVDMATLSEDYDRQYKKKYGVDLAKWIAEHEHDKTHTPAPPRDDDMWFETVLSHIKDKAGFVEAVGKYFHDRAAKRHDERPLCPLGELNGLVVNGDTATGHAKLTIIPWVAGGESPLEPGKPPVVIDERVEFRRINGGWLLDSPPQ